MNFYKNNNKNNNIKNNNKNNKIHNDNKLNKISEIVATLQYFDKAKTVILTTGLTLVATTGVSGVGLPIAGMLSVIILVISHILLIVSQSQMIKILFFDVLMITTEMNNLFDIIIKISKEFNLKINEYVESRISQKLEILIEKLLILTPTDMLKNIIETNNNEIIVNHLKMRNNKTFLFRQFDKFNRFSLRTFKQNNTEKFIMDNLLIINGFFHILFTQMEIQLKIIHNERIADLFKK